MSAGIDIEMLRQILSDNRLHLLLGLVKRVAVSADRSICQVQVSILPEKRTIVAQMSWEAVGSDCGLFMLPSVNDLVLVGQVEGDKDSAYVISRLTSGDDKIPLTALDGSFVLKSKAGKKVWVTSDTKVNISKGTTAPSENLVLGQILKSLLSSFLNAVSSHTHSYTDNGAPMTTGVPANASAFTALKANPVDNGDMLSDFAFTEK